MPITSITGPDGQPLGRLDAAAVEDGRLVYTPAEGFVGPDRVTYTVRDAGGAEDTGEALVLVSGDAADAPFVVTTADDAVDANDGVLSLREAVEAANTQAGVDTITFAAGLAGGTVRLEQAGGTVAITDDLTIDGDAADGGANGVTLVWDEAPTYDAALSAGFRAEGAAFRLEDLTLDGDRFATVRGYGVTTAIRGFDADIDLARATITDVGGYRFARAIQAAGGSVRLDDSRIAEIGSSDGGIGITVTDARVRIVDSVITDIGGGENALALGVGGVGDVEIIRSLIADTAGPGGYGYGVSAGAQTALSVADSTISGHGGELGGAAIETSGRLDLVNSTIADTSLNPAPALSPQGAIFLRSGADATLTNATVAGNLANDEGEGVTAGLYVADGAAVRLENSLFAGNYGGDALPLDIAGEGRIVSNGGNVFAQATVSGAAAGDVTGAGVDGLFAEVATRRGEAFPGGYGPEVVAPVLADNGGPKPTLALLDDPTNPAIGQAVAADTPPVDQRGFARDAAPDVGAFEAGATGPVAPPPVGDMLVVTTADDVVDASDGVLSLREAVDAANARAGADTITFDAGLDGATLTLVGGALATITDDLTVDGGEGASAVTVKAARDEGDNDPTVGAIFTAENADLDLRDLTLRDANNGVTALDATVTLDRVFLDDNGGRYGGGGVSVTRSTLVVTDGTIASYGGESNAAIRAIDGSDVRLLRSEVTGGGRYQASIDVDGSLGIDQSLVTATGGVDGGTIEIDGRLDVTNSTVARNRLPGTYQAEPFLNTDIGVIKLDAGSTGTITNSTIAGNTGTLALAPDSYGPALLIDAGATLELANSIVAGNLLFFDDTNGETAPFVQDVVGRIESNGRNIFSQEGVDGAAATDLQGVDPRDLFTIVEVDDRLLPDLADNGGPTRTVALLDDSANLAIDAADPADAPPVDGRGFARDELPDIGAFEAGAEGGPVSPSPPGLLSVDVTFLAEDADFDNTLGYYVRDAAGGFTGEAGILFPEVGDDAPDVGATASVVGFAPSDVGFFLVRDGADLGIDWAAGSVGIEDGKLVYEAPDGSDTVLQDYRVHFDGEEGQLRIQETLPLIYEWEDKALGEGSYDGDFDDAVFAVGYGRVPAPVPPIEEDGPGDFVLGAAREGAGGDDGVLL